MSSHKHTLGWLLLISVFLLFQLAAAEVITFSDSWGPNGLTVVSQEPGGVELNFSISSLKFNGTIDGVAGQTVSIPGLLFPNQAGAPDLPFVSGWLAIPQGAVKVSYQLGNCRKVDYSNLDIAPAREIPIDSDSANVPPEKNLEIYETNADYPGEVVMISPPTKMRGVDVIMIGISPLQYNPVTKQLRVYRDLRISVSFAGGNGHFGARGLRNQWFDCVLNDNLLNHASLDRINYDLYDLRDDSLIGAEVYIVGKSGLISALDTLQNYRTADGWICQLVNYDTLSMGLEGLLIYNYWMAYMYSDSFRAPVAVLIADDIEGGIISYDYSYGMGLEPPANYVCKSDNYTYADLDQDPFAMPDLVVGRFCASSTTELTAIENRIMSFENNPPSSLAYYHNPLLVGAEDWSRWFLLCTEIIGGFNARIGATLNRQYQWYNPYYAFPLSLWCTNPYAGEATNAVVAWGNSQGYIPTTQTYLQNIVGQGSTAGITSAISSGTYVVLERSHGQYDAWWCNPYNPIYTTTNWLSQTHPLGQPPSVFSINCLTGKFDQPGVGCLAENMMRANPTSLTKGALLVNSASGVSWSYSNDVYLWGIIDYMFNKFNPAFTSEGLATLMPAFGMVSGKIKGVNNSYLNFLGYYPYQGEIYAEDTNQLFHHFGDPCQRIWVAPPQNPTVYYSNILPNNTVRVKANVGALIALSWGDELLGRATATGSWQTFYVSSTQQWAHIRVTGSNLRPYNVDINRGYGDQIKSEETQQPIAAVTPEELHFGLTAWPNPFNPITTINYNLEQADMVNLAVYDISGRLVATLFDDWCEAGKYSFSYDGANLASGVYLCRLIAGEQSTTKQLIITK